MMRALGFVALALAVAPPLATQPAAAPRFDAWGLTYAVPNGWRIVQQQGRTHTLASAAGDQNLFIAPGPYRTFDEVAAELHKAFLALGLTGTPSGQPQSATINGLSAMSADYLAQDRAGVGYQVRVSAVLTPHGSGLVMLGAARMGAGAALAPAIMEALQGTRATGPPVPNGQAVQALRGRWMAYQGRADGTTGVLGGSSRSAEEIVEFDGGGRFAWSSSASVMVTTPGAGASAGGASASGDAGTYTVIGSTLVVHGQRGMATFELQVLGDRIVADGRTFLRMQ